MPTNFAFELDNYSMNQSIYVNERNSDLEHNWLDTSSNFAQDMMGRSLNCPTSTPFDSNINKTRRKFFRRKMLRSCSDNANLDHSKPNFEGSNNSFQLMQFINNETSTPKCSRNSSKINDFFDNFLSNSSSKLNGPFQRRLSMASSDSNTTIPESGDAHYEWDEYKDPCDLLQMPSRIDILENQFGDIFNLFYSFN